MENQLQQVKLEVDPAVAEKVSWFRSIPFFAMHAACSLAFWAGISWIAVLTCLFLYYFRMFGITGGYHRYFAHASYKTSRAFQFFLAWLGASSMQKGPLWWAAHHRHHHVYSDEPEDIHSPVRKGFWWSHVGWFLCPKYEATRWSLIQNLARHKELVWLNKWHLVPGLSLGLKVFAFGWLLEHYVPSLETTAFQMLVWGWFISTVLLYHGTFTINSLSHVFGKRRYPTKDDSRNNWLLAIITCGEGWHNNHHFYASAARMGFRWYEVDFTHYALTALSWVGIVWDLRRPPAHVVNAEPRDATFAKAS